MKLKIKSIMFTALLVSMFLVPIIAMGVPVKAAELNRMSMIDIKAKGDDLDISGATTFINGRIEFDKDSGVPMGRVEFHTKIYNELGEMVYSMHGKLKDAPVMILPQNYCHVRNVIWTNLWLVMGTGLLKTSDTDLEIEYRGQIITLPNTKDEYIPITIVLLVNPTGEYDLEYDGGVWEDGGWAYAGIPSYFGGVTLLTKYMENWVPE